MKSVLALLLLLGEDDLSLLRKKYEEDQAKPYAERTPTISKIGALKSDDAAEFLGTIFESDKDEAIRTLTLNALGTCATPKAVKKLAAVAKDEGQTTSFRSTALNALGNTRSKNGLELLLSIARDADPKNSLRTSAFSALSRYPLDQTETIWREALSDPQPNVRAQAFRALAPLQDKKVLDLARHALEDSQETAYVKIAALEPWRSIGGPEAIRLFLTCAESTDSALRRELLEAFEALTDEKAIETLVGGFKAPNPTVRELVARSFGKIRYGRAMKCLEAGLADKCVQVRVAALEAIANRREPESEKILQREALRGEDDATVAAVGALAGFPSSETFQLLLKLAEHRNVRVRTVGIDALGDHRSADALPVLEKAFKVRDWQVRASAIRALGKLRRKEAVDLLIDRLAKEEGRLLVDLGEALKVLTGKALGYSQGHWKDWWKANRETFAFPEKTEGVGGGGGGGTTYFGVPVLSKRIVFCLDISGSMSQKVEKGTRLDQAKKELAGVLSGLGKETWVNLIFFDDRIEPWQKQLVPLKANLQKALQKVADLQPRGGTNIYDTLEAAFQDPNVDTVYLLSDGAPGAGKFVATDEILREVRRMNRARQIIVHTVSLGASPFLKLLAEQNGGQYAEVK